jgi:hypothetical protein
MRWTESRIGVQHVHVYTQFVCTQKLLPSSSVFFFFGRFSMSLYSSFYCSHFSIIFCIIFLFVDGWVSIFFFFIIHYKFIVIYSK